MDQIDGLGSLEMSVRRDDNVRVTFGPRNECPLQTRQQTIDLADGVTHIQLQVGGNLIVPTPSGMQFPPHVAKPFNQCTFNVHVDVFQLLTERELALPNLLTDLFKACDNLPAFLVADQPHLRQHACVRLGAANVGFREPGIETDRFGECLDLRIRVLPETPSPRFCGHGSLLRESCLWQRVRNGFRFSI